ncbi:hypothetical protein [Humibacillus xanthopallidus]|uniref:hypothetical protein n=1 Tax=Humibacillus xanthopallidus TaxID=412689 RepID=UPI00384EFE37
MTISRGAASANRVDAASAIGQGARSMSTHTTNQRPALVPGAAPSTTPTKRRPGTAGYWIGAVVAVMATLGAVTWGAFAFLGWRAHVDAFVRVAPTETAVVFVTDAGTRLLYLEHDRTAAVPSVPAVTVTGPTGAEVPVAAYRGELRYDVPNVANRIGDAVLSFQAEKPGAYRVTLGSTDQGAIVAVGDNLLWTWGPQVVGIVALLLGGLFVGMTVVIVTAARRSSSRV